MLVLTKRWDSELVLEAAVVADLKLALTNLADVTMNDGRQLLRLAAFQTTRR